MKINPIRLDEEFYKLIKNLKVDRIKFGSDTLPKSDRRLSKAVARIINMEKQIYNSLVTSPLEDDTKMRSGRISIRRRK
jgi:hypothetical protein